MTESITKAASRSALANAVARLDRVDWDFPSYVPRVNTKGVHALHWYPAPFPPALPATLLDVMGEPGERVLDPFAGSGVTTIEAWMRGFQATGVDVNGFAVALGRAKVALLERGSLERGRDLAADYLRFAARARLELEECPVEVTIARAGMSEEARNWFDRDILTETAVALEWIDQVSGPDADWLWMALSSILHGVSRLRDVHYTYIVDRSKTKAPPRSPVRVDTKLADRIVRVGRDAGVVRSELCAAGVALETAPRPGFIQADAAALPTAVTGRFDLVITSPPYFGMNDYVRSQYLSWLIRPWSGYDNDLKRETGQRRKRRNQAALDDYLVSMRATFEAVYETLSPGGRLAVVIGASRTQVSAAGDPVSAVARALDDVGFSRFWTGTRRGGNRKINNSPRCVEEIWLYTR